MRWVISALTHYLYEKNLEIWWVFRSGYLELVDR